MQDPSNAQPIILSLDAGGQSLRFSAVSASGLVGETISMPTPADHLNRFLEALESGFTQLFKAHRDKNLTAISFAFPGPADYPNGVIGDLPNFPAFRGGVALGPWLQEKFSMPVFINNDGDMFALGESRFGFLPMINRELAENGSERKYHNLLAVTLGTGLGGGLVIHDQLVTGDTGSAAELWLSRNKRHSYTYAEDTLSTNALKRMYAEQIHMDPEQAPEPVEIYRIAIGEGDGVQPAARESWLRYGEVLGDILAQAGTITDAAIVVGGGLSGAWEVFSGAMMDELNGSYNLLNGKRIKRSVQKYFNIENAYFRKQFLASGKAVIKVPYSEQEVTYLAEKKIPVGRSVLGSSNAIRMGCYAFAIDKLQYK